MQLNKIAFINKVYTEAVGELLFKSYLAEPNQKSIYVKEIDRLLKEEEDRGIKTRKEFLDCFGFLSEMPSDSSKGFPDSRIPTNENTGNDVVILSKGYERIISKKGEKGNKQTENSGTEIEGQIAATYKKEEDNRVPEKGVNERPDKTENSSRNKPNTTERIKSFFARHYVLCAIAVGAVIGIVGGIVCFMPREETTKKKNNVTLITQQTQHTDQEERSIDTTLVSGQGSEGESSDNPIEPEYVSFMVNARNKRTNEWSGRIWANLTDEIEFVIEYELLPEESTNNAIIQDVLPSSMSYVEGSTYLYNDDYQDGILIRDGICDSGISLGEYENASHGTVRFNAVFTNRSDFENGDNELINWANLIVDRDVFEKEDTSVMVTITD